MTKSIALIVTVFILFMASCTSAEYDKKSNYLYGSIYDVSLPLKKVGSQLRVTISDTGWMRLVTLNNNIRLSLKKRTNLCDLKELNALNSISKDCSSVVLYSIDEKTLSSNEKSQLKIYKQNFEFNHLSGLELKGVDVYSSGVLFEYVNHSGLSTYYYKKELENSKIFQYSIFNVPSGLSDNLLKKDGPSDIEKLASYITLYLRNELSLKEFKELDLDAEVNSVP